CCFEAYRARRVLHSFPTRRSSDLGQEREQHGKGSHCSLLGLTTRQVKASGGAMSSVSVEIVLAAGRRLHRGLPDEDRRLGLLLAPDRRFSETASPRLA